MRHGSLFSGIGGFDLAAEWMGWENVFHCEWNEFGQKVLKHYWPEARSYEDITKTDFTIWNGRIDILTGGFPCQGFSTAGKRMGTDDERYLWPEMLRSIDEIKPTWIIGENVTGILSMEDRTGTWREVFARVEDRKIIRYETVDDYEAVYTRQAKMLVSSICESLEERGYEVQPLAIPACSVGAPHRRERVWFLAYRASNRWERKGKGVENENRQQRPEATRKLERRPKRLGIHEDATNASPIQLQRSEFKRGFNEEREIKGDSRQPSRSICSEWSEFPTQSPICGRDDGLPGELDGITISKWITESIKGFGNAIVPQVANEILRIINEIDKSWKQENN